MDKTRRTILKLAGASALGLGAGSLGLLGKGIASAAPALPTAANYDSPLHAKRWAMVIDTKKFDDALLKKCIDVCHTIHNVPDIPTKQNIKWLFTGDYEETFPTEQNNFLAEGVEHRKFLMLCNHCTEPPCVRVCPTKATFKREDGIVMMDYHRCIGCRYCMAGCPYGARSFNFMDPRPYIKEQNPLFPTRTRGVVEKCTFCVERLAQGLMPACVEAAGGAIYFGDLEDPGSEVRKALRDNFAIRRKPDAGTQPGVYYII